MGGSIASAPCLCPDLPTPAPGGAFDTNGLVAWWPADGNAQDAAGSHPGTVSGGGEFVTGVQGQAFSFNGTDSYVQVAGFINWAGVGG
ncbi:MAG: hypothetical protein WCS42_10075 [Verrucomicrobiota bacterium]